MASTSTPNVFAMLKQALAGALDKDTIGVAQGVNDQDAIGGFRRVVGLLAEGNAVAKTTGIALKAVRAETEEERSAAIRTLDANLLHMLTTEPRVFEMIRNQAKLLLFVQERVEKNKAALDELHATEDGGEPLPPLDPSHPAVFRHGDESWLGGGAY